MKAWNGGVESWGWGGGIGAPASRAIQFALSVEMLYAFGLSNRTLERLKIGLFFWTQVNRCAPLWFV